LWVACAAALVRDEAGGQTRAFTACYGAALQGDLDLPFTCGSQARRALIKYFFRDYALKHFDKQITELLLKRVQELWANLTHPNSYGCLDEATGRCTPSACRKEYGYAPCLDTDFTVSAAAVSQFVLKQLLLQLDGYLAFALQDTAPWTKYYNKSGVGLPAQWDASTVAASVAAEVLHFVCLMRGSCYV
jgi:hypothetical protein